MIKQTKTSDILLSPVHIILVLFVALQMKSVFLLSVFFWPDYVFLCTFCNSIYIWCLPNAFLVMFCKCLTSLRCLNRPWKNRCSLMNFISLEMILENGWMCVENGAFPKWKQRQSNCRKKENKCMDAVKKEKDWKRWNNANKTLFQRRRWKSVS